MDLNQPTPQPSVGGVHNEKKKCFRTQYSQKSPRVLHVFNHWFLALHVFTQEVPNYSTIGS